MAGVVEGGCRCREGDHCQTTRLDNLREPCCSSIGARVASPSPQSDVPVSQENVDNAKLACRRIRDGEERARPLIGGHGGREVRIGNLHITNTDGHRGLRVLILVDYSDLGAEGEQPWSDEYRESVRRPGPLSSASFQPEGEVH